MSSSLGVAQVVGGLLWGVMMVAPSRVPGKLGAWMVVAVGVGLPLLASAFPVDALFRSRAAVLVLIGALIVGALVLCCLEGEGRPKTAPKGVR